MLTLEQIQSIVRQIDCGPNVQFMAEPTGAPILRPYLRHAAIVMLAEWPDNFGPGTFTTRDVRTVAMVKLVDAETVVRVCHRLYTSRVVHEANERFKVADRVPFDPHRGLESLPLAPGFALESDIHTRTIACVDCRD